MKVLFVSAVLPYPLYSGGQIRAYNLLKRLSKHHEIYLYSFIRSDKERDYLSHVSFCKKVVPVMRGHVWQPRYLLKSMVGAYPLLWESYHNSHMESLLASEIVSGAYDMIHIEPGYIWPSLPTEKRIRMVVAEHNVEHEVYEGYVRQFPLAPLRPLLAIDVAKMKYWEKRVWTAADAIVSVSDRDKEAIGRQTDKRKISVVPNGVDLVDFEFHPKAQLSEKELKFLYVGNFAWMENRDAVEHLIADFWPALAKRYPHAQLRIVGKNMPESLRRMARLPNLFLLEQVDTIQTAFHDADIMLAPIRVGGGTKYKILEAMASGLPVITSTYGVMGMHVTSGTELLIADTIQDVITSVEVLTNSKKRMKMLEAARQCVEKQYSWDAIAQAQDVVWRNIYAKSY